MTTLDVAGNRISCLDGMDGLTKIEEIWVSGHLSCIHIRLRYKGGQPKSDSPTYTQEMLRSMLKRECRNKT